MLNSLRVTLIDEFGNIDEMGEAKLEEEGLVLEGYIFPTVGITWADLAAVLEHPFVQEQIEQAYLESLLG